jgi:putative tricarboxylic transport membrane protein
MFIAGFCGYLMKKAILDPAPLIVSFVLGQMLESALHSSLAIGYGSPSVFFLRPISATLLGFALLVVIASITGGHIQRIWFKKVQ